LVLFQGGTKLKILCLLPLVVLGIFKDWTFTALDGGGNNVFLRVTTFNLWLHDLVVINVIIFVRHLFLAQFTLKVTLAHFLAHVVELLLTGLGSK
jgi:hypothetical protein